MEKKLFTKLEIEIILQALSVEIENFKEIGYMSDEPRTTHYCAVQIDKIRKLIKKINKYKK